MRPERIRCILERTLILHLMEINVFLMQTRQQWLLCNVCNPLSCATLIYLLHFNSIVYGCFTNPASMLWYCYRHNTANPIWGSGWLLDFCMHRSLDVLCHIDIYFFQMNGSAFDSETTFSNLSPGAYYFVLRDSNHCEFNTSGIVTATTGIVIFSHLIQRKRAILIAHNCTST